MWQVLLFSSFALQSLLFSESFLIQNNLGKDFAIITHELKYSEYDTSPSFLLNFKTYEGLLPSPKQNHERPLLFQSHIKFGEKIPAFLYQNFNCFTNQYFRREGTSWFYRDYENKIKLTLPVPFVLLNSLNLSPYFSLNKFERILLFIFSSLLCLINFHFLITKCRILYVLCKASWVLITDWNWKGWTGYSYCTYKPENRRSGQTSYYALTVHFYIILKGHPEKKLIWTKKHEFLTNFKNQENSTFIWSTPIADRDVN